MMLLAHVVFAYNVWKMTLGPAPVEGSHG
jgi:hypothetical protein